MKRQTIFARFFRYETKLFLITIFLIFIAGCVSWKTFFKTPAQAEIRRDYMIEDISAHSAINPERLEKFDDVQLEIIDRFDLNGLIALERFPEATLRVYKEIKDFQIFYDVVNEYGPHHIIPVLDYYYDEGNLAMELEDKASLFIASLFNKPLENDSLTVRQKRLLAILNEIQYQKHIFLSRFIYTGKSVKRNYVSTTTSTIVTFFTGGLSNFNAAIVTRGIAEVTTEELVDAGIDILVLIPFAAMFSRSSKTASAALKGGRVTTLAEKSAVQKGVGAAVKTGRFAKITQASKTVLRAIPVRTLFKFKYVKWYVLGIAVVKPGLINHAASLVAKAISVPPIVMKIGFWFLIFFPILNLLTPLLLFVRYLWKKFKKMKTLVNEKTASYVEVS